MAKRAWTRDESLIVFSLYCRLPFGQYHRANPHVIRVAEAINRTPSAVAMRLSNFASLDPTHQQRGIKGLGNTGPALRAFWDEVTKDWTRAAVESELAWERSAGLRSNEPQERAAFRGTPAPATGSAPAGRPGTAAETPAPATGSAPAGRPGTLDAPQDPTEAEGRVKIRLVQGFFRRTVLASYGGACAVCGIRPEQLLTAGHIIPWSQNETRRADPTNGLSLCALHDRAFDAGLLGIDEGLRVLVSSRLEVKAPSQVHREALLNIKGQPIAPPTRYHPDPAALAWHREQVFKG